MYGIAKLSLKSLAYNSRLQFGKNYNAGNLNAEVYAVSYQDGAYAPAAEDVIQTPELPEKAVLPNEIQSQMTFSAATGAKRCAYVGVQSQR